MSPLAKLASAIATAEGAFTAGNVANRLNNPGDLIFAGQPGAKGRPIKDKKGKVRVFAEFDRPERGIVALYRQVLKRIAEGYVDGEKRWHPMTLRILICDETIGWAPASDGNNANNYLLETVRRTGIDPDAPLWNYLELEDIP